MSVDFKPINTVYKGYRFRSRLEARWAVFFDDLQMTWQYEAEGFTLPNGERYLPDFYFPQGYPGDFNNHAYVEIKRLDLFDSRSTEKELAKQLASNWNDVCICFGDPVDCLNRSILYLPRSDFRSGYEANEEIRDLFEMLRVSPGRMWNRADNMRIHKAAMKARQARFEHGETP